MLNFLSQLLSALASRNRPPENAVEYSVHPPHLEFLTDASPGRWIESALSPAFASVGSLVPGGYDACVRLLHPALDTGNNSVAWSTVAQWSGRVYHPLMSFEGISAPAAGRGAGPPPWTHDPSHGSLDERVTTELTALLAQFTTTPEQCYFGVWEGYGQYSGGSAMLTADGRGGRLSTPREIRRAQRVRGIGRDYLLYTGRLDHIAGFYNNFLSEPPNIWWPADRAWFVATDIDLDSTHIGASQGCIDALLCHPAVEAVPAEYRASVAMTADTINLGLPT